MEGRGQFTFYRSFWEAIESLPKKDRLELMEAVCDYGLNGMESKQLSPTQTAMFLLMKPVLDNGRKKAANGKQGGSKTQANSKQTVSKPKQTASEKEKEKEEEREKEREIEKDKESKKKDLMLSEFDSFWRAYPKKVGKGDALKAWGKAKPDLPTVLKALEWQRQAPQWLRDGGQYIPNPSTYLNQKRWEDEPVAARDKNGRVNGWDLDEDEMAAVRRMMQGG